jgi:hypothetical protein
MQSFILIFKIVDKSSFFQITIFSYHGRPQNFLQGREKLPDVWGNIQLTYLLKKTPKKHTFLSKSQETSFFRRQRLAGAGAGVVVVQGSTLALLCGLPNWESQYQTANILIVTLWFR